MATGKRVNMQTGEEESFNYTPENPVPYEVTRRQAKQALRLAGKLGNVTAALNAMPVDQREGALIDWNDAQVFQRDHYLIAALGAALGLSSSQIDDLFRSAAQL